jgi:hypothetical protein
LAERESFSQINPVADEVGGVFVGVEEEERKKERKSAGCL